MIADDRCGARAQTITAETPGKRASQPIYACNQNPLLWLFALLFIMYYIEFSATTVRGPHAPQADADSYCIYKAHADAHLLLNCGEPRLWGEKQPAKINTITVQPSKCCLVEPKTVDHNHQL